MKEIFLLCHSRAGGNPGRRKYNKTGHKLTISHLTRKCFLCPIVAKRLDRALQSSFVRYIIDTKVVTRDFCPKGQKKQNKRQESQPVKTVLEVVFSRLGQPKLLVKVFIRH